MGVVVAPGYQPVWSSHRWRCHVCGVNGPDVETEAQAEKGRRSHDAQEHPEWGSAAK